MLPILVGADDPETPLFCEHEGNAAIRRARWKLVRKWGGSWELYDMQVDRTELIDLASAEPERVSEFAAAWQEWADRCGVIPREQVLEPYQRRGRGLPPE